MGRVDAARADDSDYWWRWRLACGGKGLLCAVELQQTLFEARFSGREAVRIGFEVSLEVFLRCRGRGWEFCGLGGIENVAESVDDLLQTSIIGTATDIGFCGETVLPFVTLESYHQLLETGEVGFQAPGGVSRSQVRHPQAVICGFEMQVQESDRSYR